MEFHKSNGNDYAWDILCRNDMDAHALLEASHNQESVWLELKADPFCRKDNQNSLTDDAVWHTLKAIVAMINTRGGCVLFGIDDKSKKPVPELCDLNFDKFTREITEKFLRITNLTLKGKSDLGGKNEKRILPRTVERYCEPRICRYCGREILVLLVKPSDGEDFLWVEDEKKVKSLYVRPAGDRGMDRKLPADESRTWSRPKLDFDSGSDRRRFDNMLSPVMDFIGRADVLRKIEDCFSRFDKWCVPLLHGLGGVGKSEIAYRYAEKNAISYDSLVLIDASKSLSFVQAVAGLAKNPDFRNAFLPGTQATEVDNLSADAMFMRIREAMGEGRLGRVLMVLDDVRHPDVIRPSIINRYLGRVSQSGINIIATTRYPLLTFLDGEFIVPIEVSSFTDEEGVRMLCRKKGVDNEQNRRYAEAIVRSVGGNPWALDIIGEYLKQKPLSKDSDYRLCLDEIKKGFVNFSAVAKSDAGVVGNATGVMDLAELQNPTITAMSVEECGICSLVSMASKYQGPADAFKVGFERWYGRELTQEEWDLYVDKLKRKRLIEEKENERGDIELSLKDRLLAEYFENEARGARHVDAFLDYIKACNRLAPSDPMVSKHNFRFLMNAACPPSRKLDVVFDEDRFGWPLYLMGDDVWRIIDRKENDGRIERADLQGLLELGADNPTLAADIDEIKGMLNDNVEKDVGQEIQRILELRMRIYADNLLMCAASCLHAENCGRGVLSLDDREGLLEDSKKFLYSSAGGVKRDNMLACVYRCIAELYDEKRVECEAYDEVNKKMRDKIRATINDALKYDPYIYDDIDEEKMDDCIKEGVCP